MLFCLHVEFVFMLMSFNWLTDDLLKDNPPSKFGWSIFAAQICLFCEKYENPRNLGIVRACADKSHLCFSPIFFPATAPFPRSRASYFCLACFIFPTSCYPRAWHTHARVKVVLFTTFFSLFFFLFLFYVFTVLDCLKKPKLTLLAR